MLQHLPFLCSGQRAVLGGRNSKHRFCRGRQIGPLTFEERTTFRVSVCVYLKSWKKPKHSGPARPVPVKPSGLPGTWGFSSSLVPTHVPHIDDALPMPSHPYSAASEPDVRLLICPLPSPVHPSIPPLSFLVLSPLRLGLSLSGVPGDKLKGAALVSIT